MAGKAAIFTNGKGRSFDAVVLYYRTGGDYGRADLGILTFCDGENPPRFAVERNVPHITEADKDDPFYVLYFDEVKRATDQTRDETKEKIKAALAELETVKSRLDHVERAHIDERAALNRIRAALGPFNDPNEAVDVLVDRYVHTHPDLPPPAPPSNEPPTFVPPPNPIEPVFPLPDADPGFLTRNKSRSKRGGK